MTQAAFSLRGRNPDVLSCIANLSNDEVFTPPEFANRMLDTLAEAWAADNDGASIWVDPSVTFLDPCTKSGVFLREITKRLIDGLEPQIPDLQARVDHILTRQVFGIGITELTAMLARRSLYCSKHANGPHSITRGFNSETGNVWFERVEHTWDKKGKCTFCGASSSTLDRGDDRESHAYAFIHTEKIQERVSALFGDDMQFDVIIGNPPYQLDDGGFGASALPIYNKFIEKSKELQPRYVTMVVPARWLFGGRGLDDFRNEMLSDSHVRCLVDYPDSRLIFPGVDVAGGICYFLWDRDSEGECRIVEVQHDGTEIEAVRPLLEDGATVFIRSHLSLSILKKVMCLEAGSNKIELPQERRFDRQVSSQKPFGLRTFFRGDPEKSSDEDLMVLQSRGRAWTKREKVSAGFDLIDKWKVFTSKSSSEHAGQYDKNGQRRVLSLSGVIPPGSVVTETYVLLGAYDDELQARNCYSYVASKFFRFLVATRSSGQDLARSAYSFVPLQDFHESWDDEKLYAKYGLTDQEIAHIEKLIRPMPPVND